MDLSLSLLLIRFTAGMLLMGHGAQKLVGGGGPGLRNWTGAVGQMGFRPARFWAVLSVSAELLGGIALAIGFLTPVAAAVLVGQLFVAIAKAHWTKGLWITAGGVVFIPLAAIAVIVDALMIPTAPRRPPRSGTRSAGRRRSVAARRSAQAARRGIHTMNRTALDTASRR